MALFMFSFVCNARSLDHQFFLFFLCKVSHPNVRIVMDPSFWKKLQIGLACPKVRFLEFWKKSYSFRYTSSLQYRSAKKKNFFFDVLQKQHVCKKCGSWVMVQKPQIRMQDSLSYNTSQKTWDMKLNSRIWLEVQEYNKYLLAASRGCAHAHLNMPKVTTNSESALSQEWVELWS